MVSALKSRDASAILRWFFVLYLTLSPRVVGHRHSDVAGLSGDNRVLATHLACFHGCDSHPIDDRDVHFHLTFSLAPTIPVGYCTESVQSVPDVTAWEIAAQYASTEWVDAVDTDGKLRQPHACDIPIRWSPSNFRRIHYSVWLI